MDLTTLLQRWRHWFPMPKQGEGFEVTKWLLLEGNRNAVSILLVLFVFVTIMAAGIIWPFELRRLLTDTQAVQTILTTLLSGIILLVSVVVSINSIILSYDITSIEQQEKRVERIIQFRREVAQSTTAGENASNPMSFLEQIGVVLGERAQALAESAENADEEIAADVKEYAAELESTADRLSGPFPNKKGAEFGVLWLGLEVDYGPFMDRSNGLKNRHGDRIPDEIREQLDRIVETLKLFATGKEYFKTLYYSQEVALLSRTLLVVSLPAILINATAILAINAGLFPKVWVLGLPPLLSFIATIFTISLTPYLILTAYMLRLATVARQTNTVGPFSLAS